jgi:hypothetical protein
VALFHFLEELRIVELRRRGLLLAAVELVENGHQHQGDDQPDCNTFEHVIQDSSLSGNTTVAMPSH